jgi:putative membrane protein
MSKRIHRVAFTTLTGLLALAPAFAQTPTNSTGSSMSSSSSMSASSSKLAMGDSRFMKNAAEAGMAEVQLGQLAAQKATSADVKSFGQHMVDDHTKANDQLKRLAAQKGVTLPDSPSMMQKHDVDRLSKMSGADFDRAFMDQMVKDHKKVVAEFDKASKGSKDSDVKSFASSTLPTLQDHLQMAQTLDSTVGGKKSK